MYALDNVTFTRPTFDIAHIPQHITDLFLNYESVPYSQWPDETTTAQKRTRTMRFNKFCNACEAVNLDASTTLFLLTNAKCSRQIG